MSKIYQVKIEIYNSFNIKAETKEEAEKIVRELDCYKTLDNCDLRIAQTKIHMEETNEQTN